MNKYYSQTALIRTYVYGHLLFGQNFPTPEFFIIPLHVSVRKKYTVIRNFLIRNLALIQIKFNRILNFFHIYECIFYTLIRAKVYPEVEKLNIII